MSLELLKNKLVDEDSNEKIIYLFAIFIIGFILAYSLINISIKRRSHIIRIIDFKKRISMLFIGAILSTVILILFKSEIFIVEISFYSILTSMLLLQIPLFLMSIPILSLMAETIFKRHINLKIARQDMDRKINKDEFMILEDYLNDEKNIPIGISKVIRTPVTISSKYRTHHMMVTGASGYGKTSMAFTVMRHDLRWNRPIIFIDPKADKEDIHLAQNYAKLYGREKDFYLFSDNMNEKSIVYNPLRLGDAGAKAEKICAAFDLSHEHWGKVAQSFLITLFQIFEVLEIEDSLQNVSRFIDSKEAMQDLLEAVNDLPDSETVIQIKQKIPRLSKMKAEELSGLQAGLTAINSSSLKNILNPQDCKKEIDLIELIETNKVIYFDVNPSDKEMLMGQVGKFIIKDIKLLAGKLQKKQIRLKSDYLPVFIDEIDLFIDERFHEFSKTARSGKMALMVLFQSVSSLDNIGQHLKEMMSIFDVSMHFNTGSQTDLDYVAQRPGTMRTKEQSHQVDRSNIHNLTGMGTEFSADVFRLDPNLLRDLKVDEFFIYDKTKKSSLNLDLVSSWSSKLFFKNAKNEYFLNDASALDDRKRKVTPLKRITPEERVLLSEPISHRQMFYDSAQRRRFNELKNEWIVDCLENNSWYPWKFLRK